MGPAPPVLRDQGGRERRTGQRADPDPRDRDPDRERPVPVEPAADGRDHRHVPARHGHPDAEAVPEVPTHSCCAADVTSNPTAKATAPTSSTGRGPTRSTARPLTEPSRNQQQAVIEKTSDVAPLPVPNSAAIGAKKAPKL